MSKVMQCDSCEELRQNAPNFIINGLGEEEVDNLFANTGLAGNSKNCADVNDLNDCLIGNMEKEVNSYEACDWKVYMKKFAENLWTVLKSMITWMCGMQCRIDQLSNPNPNAALYPDNENVKFRKVSGVSLRYDPEHPRVNDAPLVIRCIGSVARITGSLTCKGSMPSSYTSGGSSTDWLDFYRGGSDITNKYGHSSYQGNCPSGGLLLYEYEVKACDWGFKRLYDSPLHASHAGFFLARIMTFRDGDEYPYDCGYDADGNGQIYHPSSDEFDTLIQVRMMAVNTWGITHNNGNITPNGLAMVQPCQDSWEC